MWGFPHLREHCGFAAERIGGGADVVRARFADHARMEIDYGVTWREGALPPATGKLELLPRELRLEGLAESCPVVREIPYDGLAAVRVGRSAAERIDGRPTVVLERRAGVPITIATVAQSGVVGEIVERLASLQSGATATRRTAIVLPLRKGAAAAVRALLEAGPPFDPEELPGLDAHDVFVTASEAVFVFESRLGGRPLARLLGDPALWKAAAAWRKHLAGPPRVAEEVYVWRRPEVGDAVRSNGSTDAV